MRFRFGEQSGLSGRVLQHEITRFAYVPRNEEGRPEYVFAYAERIPGPCEEPDLFRGANEVISDHVQVEIKYRDISDVVLLLTIEADDTFRKEHPDLVSQNELFVVEE